MSDVNEQKKFRIVLDWVEDGPTVIEDVVGYKLESDVYFFFLEEDELCEQGYMTVWVKHPELLSIQILPLK